MRHNTFKINYLLYKKNYILEISQKYLYVIFLPLLFSKLANFILIFNNLSEKFIQDSFHKKIKIKILFNDSDQSQIHIKQKIKSETTIMIIYLATDAVYSPKIDL